MLISTNFWQNRGHFLSQKIPIGLAFRTSFMKRRLNCVSNSMYLSYLCFYACIPVTLYLSFLCFLCLYPSICLYLSYLCFLCLYPSILVSVLSIFSMLESQYPCISMITVSFTNYLRISPQGVRLENQFKATRRNSSHICNLSSFQISAAFVKSLKQHLCLQF